MMPCLPLLYLYDDLSYHVVGELEVHVVQSLTASLGGAGGATSARAHHSMATVCRMTRALLFPPQFKTLKEWFHYAFANSEIDGMYL